MGVRPSGLALAVAGTLAGLAIVWSLREREVPRRAPFPSSAGFASPERAATDAELPDPGALLSRQDRAARSGAAPRDERQRLAEGLRRTLGPDLPADDLERLASLVLESRDVMHGEESPVVRQEILRRIALEFERLAGEPMGDVISRLPRHEPDAPRPPRGAESG